MLGKNLTATILTQIPIFILGVVSGVFSTRILGDETKGIFSIFQANTQLFVLVFSLGIQTGIVYFISSKKIKASVVLGMTTYILALTTALLAVILTLLYFSNTSDVILTEHYDSAKYLICIFILYIFTILNTMLAALMQAYSRFRTINLITFTNSVLNACAFIVLFFTFDKSMSNVNSKFDSVLYTSILILGVNSLMWLFAIRSEIKELNSFDFNFNNDLRMFISYNLLIYIGMFINFFNYRLDLWIVNNYADKQDLSYYSLAANINQIILIISVTISSVVFPNLSKKSEEERMETFIRLSRICFCLFFGIAGIGYLLSSFIIPFMYGEEFTPTVFPFQLLLPGILFSSITQIFSIYLVSSNRNLFNIMACSAGLIATVTLDLILIPKYSIEGASIASSISYFIIFLFTYVMIIRYMKPKTINLFIPGSSEIKFLQNALFKTAR